MLTKLVLLSTTLLLLHTTRFAHGSSLSLLLRELERVEDEDERSAQLESRVDDVMRALLESLDVSGLEKRTAEGTICKEDNVKATCEGPVQCSSHGKCIPSCDSSSHDNRAHFICVCEGGYTAQLCDVASSEALQKCDRCKEQGGKHCFLSSGSDIGYYCLDSDYHHMEVTSRGLEKRDSLSAREEGLATVARAVHAFIARGI